MLPQIYVLVFVVFACKTMSANGQAAGMCPFYTDPSTGVGSSVGCSECQYCPDGSVCNLCFEPTSRPTVQGEPIQPTVPVMGKCPVWYNDMGQKVQAYCAGCQFCPDGSLCNECSTAVPTDSPTFEPTDFPTANPSFSQEPTFEPSMAPSSEPSLIPSSLPSMEPTILPSTPSYEPTNEPSSEPSQSTTPTENPTTQPSQNPTIDSLTPTVQPSQKPVLDSSTLRSNANSSTMASGAVAGIAASLFVVVCVCLPVLYLLCCAGGAGGRKDEEGKEPGEGSHKPTYYFDYEGNAGMSAMNGNDDTEKPFNDNATDIDSSDVGKVEPRRATRRGSSVSTAFAPISHNNNPIRHSPSTDSEHSHTCENNHNHNSSEEESENEFPSSESARSTSGLIHDSYTV